MVLESQEIKLIYLKIYIQLYNIEDNDWIIEENSMSNFRIQNNFIKLSARNTNWEKFEPKNAKDEIKKAYDMFNNKKIIKPSKLVVNRANKLLI